MMNYTDLVDRIYSELCPDEWHPYLSEEEQALTEARAEGMVDRLAEAASVCTKEPHPLSIDQMELLWSCQDLLQLLLADTDLQQACLLRPVWKIENPAIAFTKQTKGSSYDHLSDEEFQDLLNRTEQLSALWQGNPSVEVPAGKVMTRLLTLLPQVISCLQLLIRIPVLTMAQDFSDVASDLVEDAQSEDEDDDFFAVFETDDSWE